MSIETAFLILGWGLLGAIITHAITSGNQTGDVGKRPKQHDDPAENADEPTDSNNPQWAGFKRLVAKMHSEESRHNSKERRFWKRQVRISYWLNWITFFAGVVAWIGLGFLYKSIVDAENATAFANRAWLLVDGPTALIGNSGTVETIEEQINITNIGKEPAADVRNYLRPFWLIPVTHPRLEGGTDIDMREQVYKTNDTCDYVDSGGDMGTLWPRVAPYVANEAGPKRVDPGFDGGTVFYGFQACVRYTTFSEPHYTRVCYVFTPKVITQKNTWIWSLCQGKGQQWAN